MLERRDQMRKISRRSFLWAGASLIAGYGGFRWIASRRQVDGLPWPLRNALGVNESIWSDAFSQAAMAPTFDPGRRTTPRVNGGEGMSADFDPAAWSMTVAGAGVPAQLTLDDVKALPRHEFTTQLCCIEGWSMVVTWAGARLRDLAAKYPQAMKAAYVALATPDGGYYVGLDMQSAMHPQTLLCYEMNGEPLTLEHGAPLRLVIPTKYGIKNIKRIGLIHFTNTRPPDFWAERGYDWYAGL